MYPFVQQQADRSPLELSFLHPDSTSWRRGRRPRALVCSNVSAIRLRQLRRLPKSSGGRIEGTTSRSTDVPDDSDLRVQDVLIPKKASLSRRVSSFCTATAAPCSGQGEGGDNEHAALSEFKNQGTKDEIATELWRGYVVITIDIRYWGERRMLLEGDAPSFRGRRG
jgi:hypothetical protein